MFYSQGLKYRLRQAYGRYVLLIGSDWSANLWCIRQRKNSCASADAHCTDRSLIVVIGGWLTPLKKIPLLCFHVIINIKNESLHSISCGGVSNCSVDKFWCSLYGFIFYFFVSNVTWTHMTFVLWLGLMFLYCLLSFPLDE